MMNIIVISENYFHVSSDHYCSVLKTYWDLLFDDEHDRVPESNLIFGENNCEYMLPKILLCFGLCYLQMISLCLIGN